MIYFITPRESATVPADYINRGNLQEQAEVLLYEDVLEATELPRGVYVFTGINRLGPATARLLATLHESVEAATGVRPLNHPTRTLRRYELLKALHERGLNPFTAYGAWEDYSAVRFPAFVRPREADGGIPVLVNTLGEVECHIGQALMDGWALDDLIVVEFEDTSVAGIFTKYSAYAVEDRVLPTGMNQGPEWVMRRHAAQVTADTIDEATRYVLANPHENQLAEIFSIARTDFGRIDYSMKNGRVVCWEINTLPLQRHPVGVAPLPPHLQKLTEVHRSHFATNFASAFADTLTLVPEGSPIRPDLDPDLVTAAREELAARGVTTSAGEVRFQLLRALLRPLKPILKPVAAAVIQPMMARRARRAHRAP